MSAPWWARCIECHVNATGGVTSEGRTIWHCADPFHELCARRVLGLPDVEVEVEA